MLERQVENPVVDYAKKQGMKVRKMNGQGFNHWPDRLFLGEEGLSFWVEFKRPGGVLSPGQEIMIDDLRRMGHRVYVCDDPGKGKAIIDAELSR